MESRTAVRIAARIAVDELDPVLALTICHPLAGLPAGVLAPCLVNTTLGGDAGELQAVTASDPIT